MDNQRLLVWGGFGFLLFLTWQAWQQDYGIRPGQPQAPSAEQSLPTDAPPQDTDLPELPSEDASGPPDIAAAPPANGAPVETENPELTNERIVTIVTDVLELDISSRGGTLRRAVLKNYPVAKDRPDVSVELLSPQRATLGLLHTGVRLRNAEEEPNQFAVFSIERERYELGGDDELVIPLSWTNAAGVRLEKRYRIRRGSYRIDIEQRLINRSESAIDGAAYAQLQRHSVELERSMFDVDTYSFDGPIVYDGEKAEKLQRDDLLDDGPFNFGASGGWVAVIQHHFLSAIVPTPDQQQRFSVSVRSDVSTSNMIGPAQSVAPGAEAVFNTTAFVGPKLQAQLEDIDETLKLTVDYGWLTIISQPLFWLLSAVFSFVKNWGVAIIVVTILIKLAFYKLTEASGRSMAKMREIQPRMKALQDRYKDDRQALSQAMMDLYKREKVNPAAGCLPILIQMPFFLAFYWVLLESVEMRQAPFALWITDLSSRDPYFILPLIMGAAMFFQQKLNPAPADPVQAKVMQIMPIMFTGFFAFFPSGLVLYWVTNTLLSIAQQWHINKVVSAEGKQGRKAAKKKKTE